MFMVTRENKMKGPVPKVWLEEILGETNGKTKKRNKRNVKKRK